VAIQYDPMNYLSNYRKFCLQNAQFVSEYKDREKRGVFGDDELEESMIYDFEDKVEEIHQKRETESDSMELKLNEERILSMMFPLDWKEAKVEMSALIMCHEYMKTEN
jgi:hypothetical protein